jgi:phenylpyruvate tautomerase PptA (4-oxalocrotonate tautomerase family)
MPLVRVTYPRGALAPPQKRQLAAAVTEIALDAEVDDDGGDPTRALRVWVLVHEVREGSWGAAGRTVSALDVAQFINPDLPAARRAEIAAKVAPARLGA